MKNHTNSIYYGPKNNEEILDDWESGDIVYF
jgi:hypothetical protein